MVQRRRPDMDEVKLYVHEMEQESPETDERVIADKIVMDLKPAQVRELAAEELAQMIWDARRARVARIEKEAEAHREREWEKRQQAREAADQAIIARYYDSDGYKNLQRETSERELLEAERKAAMLQEREDRFKRWAADPSTYDVDIREQPISGRLKANRPAHHAQREGWAAHNTFSDWFLEHFSELGWLDFPTWVKAAADATGRPRHVLLTDFHLHYQAFASVLDSEIEERASQMALELTTELLRSEFALGDGVRVKWGDATSAQHEQRYAMLLKNAAANAEGAARHRAAVNMLEKSGASCLAEVAA